MARRKTPLSRGEALDKVEINRRDKMVEVDGELKVKGQLPNQQHLELKMRDGAGRMGGNWRE